jgi:hypothetical protein
MDVPENCERIVHCLVICVNSCLLTQQEAEIEVIKQSPYYGVKWVLVPLLPEATKPHVKVQPPEQVVMVGVPRDV